MPSPFKLHRFTTATMFLPVANQCNEHIKQNKTLGQQLEEKYMMQKFKFGIYTMPFMVKSTASILSTMFSFFNFVYHTSNDGFCIPGTATTT